MRTRLLFGVLLLGLLPVAVGDPASASGGAELVVRVPRHAVEVGKPVVLTARFTRLRGISEVEVMQRTGRRWTWVDSTFRVRDGRLRITVVPTTVGRVVYRILADETHGHRHAWDRVAIRARLDPHPRVVHHWSPQPDGRARASLFVALSQWVPGRPRLALQQQIAGRWTTLRSADGRRAGSYDDWGFELDATVSGPGALRVVGSGPGWRVAEALRPYVIDAGRAAFGVPVPVRPHGQAVRRVTFDARAGEKLQVLTGDWTFAELRDPSGREISLDFPHHHFDAPVTGRYTVDIAPSDVPGTVLVARPVRASLDTEATALTLPAVADKRVIRRVEFSATAGDVVVVDATPCAQQPLLIEVATTGVVQRDLDCGVADAISVRAARAKIVDIAPDAGPVEVAGDRPGQPLALRFSTPPATTDVEMTIPWTIGQVEHAWPGSRSGRWVGNLDATYSSTGPHLFVVRPRRAMTETLVGRVELTSGPRR